ncbi:hypothetical protein AcW1_001302 [Taiwanofungus camphoratus]|nr:hypothetical protein AcW1_001302 [Antrodia cinnamomea]
MPADGPFWQASYGLWPASIVLPGTGRSGLSYYFGKSWGPHVQSSTPFPDSSIASVRTTATQSSAQDPPTSSVDVTSSSWSSPPPPSLPMSVSPLPNSGTFSSNVATHSSSEVDSSVNPMSAPQSVAGDSSSFSAVVGVAASSQSSTGVSGGTIYSKPVHTTAIPDSTFSTVMNPSSTYTPVSLTTSTSSGVSSSSSKTPQIVGAVLGTLGALLLILVAFFYYRRRTSRRRLESRQDWWCEVHPEPSLPPQSGVSPSPAPVTISESVGSYGTGLHTTDNESGQEQAHYHIPTAPCHSPGFEWQFERDARC